MHVLSKTISPIKNNKHLHLSNNQSSNHNINKFIEDKEKNLKKQILYKKRKLKELKKNEENEQMILRDINRRIKSIYDSLKTK